MRTPLTNLQIESRVDSLTSALKLEACQNVHVGNELKKGISGGERKRTSIGYELITNPSIMFLDEPTSGLDSFSALKICQLLKKEAERGMTLIATIHQPSSDIFNCFDKVLVLADGNQIFYDKPFNTKHFFKLFNIELPLYKTPAD